MDLVNHPPADSKAMFTQVQPHVKERHRLYRETLDNIVKEENEQQSANKDSR